MQVTPQRQSYQAQTSFKGLRSKDARALFALDLDGTLLKGTDEEIKKVFELAKKANAIVTYATGQTKKEFFQKQQKYAQKGINIPTPNYFVSNNGQFIYKNIDGELVEDINWRKILKEKTSFDREIVVAAMQKLGQSTKYKYSPKKITELENFKHPQLGGIDIRKKEDPHFWNSKISYYEWNPSEHMVEYFVAHDVDIPALKIDIKDSLATKNITPKFIYHEYNKEIMDACPVSILRQSRPLREDENGKMKVLFICPADKADGVKYLGQKLNISENEILSAGNDSNDYSLADLSKTTGAFFVCVGNAVHSILEHAKKLNSDTIIFAKSHGSAGIAEGIETIMARFGTN